MGTIFFKQKTLKLISLVYIFCIPIYGQNNNLTEEEDSIKTSLGHQKLDEITVQAPISITSFLKWPGSYSKLDALKIEQGNSFNLYEQLNKVPGVNMQQGTLSTNRITIRGIGSRTPYHTSRIKAYWGDIPLTDGDGATSIEDIGLNDIANIHIIKGASSSLYGAGMGGAILIDPFLDDSLLNLTTIKSEVASFNAFSNHANVNWKCEKSGNYSIVGGVINSKGYRENSNYNRYNVTFKGKQRLGNNYLKFLYNYTHLNGEIPSSLNKTDFKRNPQKAAFTWKNIGGYEESWRNILGLSWISTLGNMGINSLTVFGKQGNIDELRPFNRLKEGRISIGLREKLTYTAGDLHVDVGTELMLEDNNASYYTVEENNVGKLINRVSYKRSYYNIFALAEYTFSNNWLIQGSLNINRTKYEVDDDNTKESYNYPWIASPRLGVNYKNGSTNLFAAVGHGFSVPSTEESQMPDGSFNMDIKPEEGWNYEVGARYQSINNGWNADVTFYLMRMKNLLVTERDEIDQFYGKNAGKTSHLGLELTINGNVYQQSEKRKVDMSVNYFTSQNKFVSFVDDGNDYKSNFLPGIPSEILSTDILIWIKPIKAIFNYKSFGSQFLNDSNTKRYSSYHKISAKLELYNKWRKTRVKFYIGIDNIFDINYASMIVVNAKAFGDSQPRYYYPGLPFNVFGGVQMSL